MDEKKKDKKSWNTVWSIIIPVRNNSTSLLRMVGELYKQIREVYSETSPVNIVVVDDASPDIVRLTMESFVSNANDGKGIIKYMRLDERRGAGGARNFGLKYAKEVLQSMYVSFLDSDDYISSHFVKEVMNVLVGGKTVETVMWGFAIKHNDPKQERLWIPKFNAHKDEDWTAAPVAPWIHAIATFRVVPFPENILTDDAIWWIRQAEIIATCVPMGSMAFIEKPLYIYDKTSGGCTRAADYFSKNPTTLEAIACNNVCQELGFPDRFISDCLRNLAELYDMRNDLTDERVRRVWNNRFHTDYSLIMTGRWGW